MINYLKRGRNRLDMSPESGGWVSPASSVGQGWVEPSDWVDISNPADNTIEMVIGDFGTGLAFTTTIASSGTYTIDWGDGTIDTSQASDTTYQHQYTVGAGKACSLGYTTFKLKIYGATAAIQGWSVRRHTWTNRPQYAPILSANFVCAGMTTYANAFYYSNIYCRDLMKCKISSFANCSTTSAMFQYCATLASVTLPTSWGSITNTSSMFRSCAALASVTLPTSWGSITDVAAMFQSCTAFVSVTLPTSWGSITSTSSMFASCNALVSVTLPTSWGSVTNTSYMFQVCYALASITLPTSWGSVTSTSSMFQSCFALASVTLPTSWGSVTSTSYMFQNCYALKTINVDYLGSNASATDFTSVLQDCENLASNLSFGALITKIGIMGASGYVLHVTSIRLTNASSPFSGTSPQVDVSYTNLSATDLNNLFGDLPTLVGKTIKITGSTGAGTCTTSIATTKGWTVTN